MHRHFFSLRIAAAVVLAAIAVATIDLLLNGFVVLADPDRQLSGASLPNSHGDRPMRRIADGFWAGRAHVDGLIVMHCTNGAELPGYYVTSRSIVRETVRPGACAAAAGKR